MSLATNMRFQCATHGLVKLRQYNIGSAELEYYGCPKCDRRAPAIEAEPVGPTGAPERIWAWSFNDWEKWGGYARDTDRRPLCDRERRTGAEYIRADLAPSDAESLRGEVDRVAVLEATLDAIEELNRTGADENGHRWVHSDLIAQEIMAARGAIRSPFSGGANPRAPAIEAEPAGRVRPCPFYGDPLFLGVGGTVWQHVEQGDCVVGQMGIPDDDKAKDRWNRLTHPSDLIAQEILTVRGALPKLAALTPQPDAGLEALVLDAQFLLDRLAGVEGYSLTDEDAREWHGHVAPAMSRLAAALRSRPVGEVWQDIATAPMDRSQIIVGVPDQHRAEWIVGEAYFDPEAKEWFWAGTGVHGVDCGPISEANHWLPELWRPMPEPDTAPARIRAALTEGGE